MTTLGDRMDNLENAVIRIVPMLERIVETQGGMLESLERVVETQGKMMETQEKMMETQERMMGMLETIIEKLNEHSSELTLIKNYIS